MNEKLSVENLRKLNSQLEVLHFHATPDYINDLFSDKNVEDVMMDACNQGIFCNLIAEKITGMKWPSNTDSKEKTEVFFTAFIKAVDAEKGLFWIN